MISIHGFTLFFKKMLSMAIYFHQDFFTSSTEVYCEFSQSVP